LPVVVHAARREIPHGVKYQATFRAEVTKDNNGRRHKGRLATVPCTTEATSRRSVQDIRCEASRLAAAIVAATEAAAGNTTFTATAAAAAAAANNIAAAGSNGVNKATAAAAATTTTATSRAKGTSTAAAAAAIPTAAARAYDDISKSTTASTDRHLSDRQITSTPHVGMIARELAGYHRLPEVPEPCANELAGYHRLPEVPEPCANELAGYHRLPAVQEPCDNDEVMSQPDVAHMLHQATQEQQDEVPSLIPSEPFIPIEAQNAQDLRATKSTISKQLDVMQHSTTIPTILVRISTYSSLDH
jgi:hypothetical protein